MELKKKLAAREYDTLVVTTAEDFRRLAMHHHRLWEHLESRKLIFVGNKDVGSLLEKAGYPENVLFLDENDIIPFSDVAAVMTECLRERGELAGREAPRGVVGWYYQQFLKMQYSRICQDDYYMSWDGDTVPCVDISMFDPKSDRPFMDLKNEYDENFFITMKRLLPDLKKIIRKSCISEHMLFHCGIMRSMLADIEKNGNFKGDVFWEKILRSIPKLRDACFSEFETYGSYAALHYPSQYLFRNWHSFRRCGIFFDPSDTGDGDFIWFGKDFEAVSFEKIDKPDWMTENIFRNPKFRSRLSARKMVEIVQKDFGFYHQEEWEDGPDQDPISLSGASPCQNAEQLNPALIDELISPSGASLCQNSERPNPTVIDEWREYELLGDARAPENPDHAFLCYENAEFLCTDSAEKERLRARKAALLQSGLAHVRHVTIVIVTRNEHYMTEKCVESIRAYCSPDAYGILVLDNASDDGTAEWLKAQGDIGLLLSDENMGYVRGLNEALSYVPEGDDVLLLHQDARMAPNALFWLRMGLYEDSGVGAAGCVSNYAPIDQLAGPFFPLPAEYLAYGRERNVPMEGAHEEKAKLSGFALLLRRDALDRVGGRLDEAFSPAYLEDDDLCMRLRKAGFRLLCCHNSFVYHAGLGGYLSSNDASGLEKKNSETFLRKWGGFIYAMTEEEARFLPRIERGRHESFRFLYLGAGSGAMLDRVKRLFPHAILFGTEEDKGAASQSASVPLTCLNWKSEALPFPERYFDYIIVNEKRSGGTLSLASLRNLLDHYLREDGVLLKLAAVRGG